MVAEALRGGMKMGGTGRELGLRGIGGYLETKQVHINLNGSPMGSY
jgi:acyl-CoA reductase-like NAD-dependent aldehyde dehydrogenase